MRKVSAGEYKVIVLASPLRLRAPTSLLSALSHPLKYFSFLTQFFKLIFPLMFVTGVEFTFVLCIFSFPKQPWKLFSLNCWHFTLHRRGVLWLKVGFGVVCRDFECTGITASTSKESVWSSCSQACEMLVLCRELLLTPQKKWEIPCAAGGEPHTQILTGITLRQVGKYSLWCKEQKSQPCKCSGKIRPFRGFFHGEPPGRFAATTETQSICQKSFPEFFYQAPRSSFVHFGNCLALKMLLKIHVSF